MYFLYDHVDPCSFVNCYADTDSMALAKDSFCNNFVQVLLYRAIHFLTRLGNIIQLDDGIDTILPSKQTQEKKSSLRCAPSLLFSHGEKIRHHAKRRCARWISSLGSVYRLNTGEILESTLSLNFPRK